MRHLAWAGSLTLALALSSLAHAQAQVLPQAATPGAAQQRQIEEERRLREQGRQPERPATDPLRIDPPKPPVTTPGAEAVRFAVREIRFSPSAILSEKQLEDLARKALGPQVSLADLQRLVAEINTLYRARGVVTALAVLPPQDVSSGIVEIRLIEGRLGDISLQGNASTEASFVTDRIPLASGDLVDLGSLEDALVRFNRTNDVQIAGELLPGDQLGLTDLSLLLSEPPRQQFQVFTDNLGVPATGTYRIGASYLNRSLLGYRDDLSLLITGADGLLNWSVAYGFPINTGGGRLNFGYYVAETSIKNGTLAPLNLSGSSVAKVITLRQPTYVSRRAQLDVVASAGWSNSDTDIDDVPLQQLDSNYQSLGLEGRIFEAQGSTFASYTYTAGRVTSEERRDFRISRVALLHNRNLAGGWSLWGSGSGQWSNSVLLPSNQQYFIGGEGSVRGYPTGLLGGDEGYTASLELRRPLPLPATRPGGDLLAMSGFMFIDYGRVYPFRPTGSVLPHWQQITGAGFGLRGSLGRNLFGMLTFAYGLTDVPLLPRPYAITFQLSAGF